MAEGSRVVRATTTTSEISENVCVSPKSVGSPASSATEGNNSSPHSQLKEQQRTIDILTQHLQHLYTMVCVECKPLVEQFLPSSSLASSSSSSPCAQRAVKLPGFSAESPTDSRTLLPGVVDSVSSSHSSVSPSCSAIRLPLPLSPPPDVSSSTSSASNLLLPGVRDSSPDTVSDLSDSSSRGGGCLKRSASRKNVHIRFHSPSNQAQEFHEADPPCQVAHYLKSFDGELLSTNSTSLSDVTNTNRNRSPASKSPSKLNSTGFNGSGYVGDGESSPMLGSRFGSDEDDISFSCGPATIHEYASWCADTDDVNRSDGDYSHLKQVAAYQARRFNFEEESTTEEEEIDNLHRADPRDERTVVTFQLRQKGCNRFTEEPISASLDISSDYVPSDSSSFGSRLSSRGIRLPVVSDADSWDQLGMNSAY
eukprot:GILK01008781.1.p1 GENE.GILK01008781.1~~GILK01008781.1.p1  ORF type:complete len:448 (+),score=60.44 GILK01008781.1:75-1346(+)